MLGISIYTPTNVPPSIASNASTWAPFSRNRYASQPLPAPISTNLRITSDEPRVESRSLRKCRCNQSLTTASQGLISASACEL